ncbi:2-keto-4-methylthiobutyrate aminotransferase [Sulfurisoma sediminicola]|uniref:2-keto-4-methylthiobutyrate aminotransferase n=2 Tax=Sulfurisoma sediminicola TaxID=1381557 RepID=A0A497XB40_9PROT|nr:2-keto-4-methylthiobutyrate aminotransferase [Sulfurisoma sediminicola]
MHNGRAMPLPVPPSKLPAVGTTIFTVMSRLAAEHGAINLSQGFPDFAPPTRLPELVVHHMAAGANQYAPMAGAASLREAIAQKVATLYGAAYDVEGGITVTAGATQAIYTAIAAFVRPGDEVIVFAPVYDSYVPAIELNGGHPVFATLRHPDYRPDWDEVAALITPKTRMIVINTPHNPSGAVWEAADLAALERLTRETGIIVVADEVYEHMVYDGRRHESVMRHPGLRQRSIAVSSFGKTYHITGWKIAYCLAPRELMAEFRKAHQYVVFAVNHPMQLALADFMREQPRFATDLAGFYQAKRDFFRRELEGSRFVALSCRGTYFQLARYDGISDMPDTEFARWLTVEHGVAAIPISVFSPSGEDHRIVRFCFAKHEETLAAAGARLRTVGRT